MIKPASVLIAMLTIPALAQTLAWRDLPALPQPLGGQFVGVIGGSLAVAGGSFWEGTPWDGGAKKWSDEVYVLDRGTARWRTAGRIPKGSGYGVAIDTPDGMLCIGGQTASEVLRQVYLLQLRDGKIAVTPLGDLPTPLMTMGAALLGGDVYLAGGQSTLTPTVALRKMWRAPLADIVKGKVKWREVEPWPGPARFFGYLTAAGNALYLVAGTDLVGTGPVRKFLQDAYVWTPEKSWSVLPNLPVLAQAGFAASAGGEVLLLGGNDGTFALREAEMREKHPGFSRTVWALDAARKHWRNIGEMPGSLVTSGLTWWGGEIVIAGGEDRPGHRSARVIAAQVK